MTLQNDGLHAFLEVPENRLDDPSLGDMTCAPRL
jgi:hypothetical protein